MFSEYINITVGVANGKSETETEKFSDVIEEHICDRQIQNVRLRDPLIGCARYPRLG